MEHEALAVVERDLRAQGLLGEIKFIVPAFWEGRTGIPGSGRSARCMSTDCTP
jgi:hypothetical protein